MAVNSTWPAGGSYPSRIEASLERVRSAARTLARHTLLVDAMLAVGLAAGSGVWLADHPWLGWLDWVFSAVLCVPLVLRRRFPVGVFIFLSAVAFLQWLATTDLLADAALLVALYTVAEHRSRSLAAGAAGIIEGGAVLASVRWHVTGSWLRSLVYLSGLVAASLFLGVTIRSRRDLVASLVERAERLERERDQQAQIAAASERARIAREMHDVIAHSLAVMVSLADGAQAKLASNPTQARAAMSNVSELGRQALGETRRLVGVLRADQSPDGLAPQPGIDQLEELVAQVRATGLDASLVVEGEPREVPAGAGLALYRIAQEAATNTLKHAVQAHRFEVRLRYGDAEVELSAEDDGQPRLVPKASAAVGHGLHGMRERAALYGGRVEAGPGPGGWRVWARLRVGHPGGAGL
jgi:signal transduction histidine kinase